MNTTSFNLRARTRLTKGPDQNSIRVVRQAFEGTISKKHNGGVALRFGCFSFRLECCPSFWLFFFSFGVLWNSLS